MKLNQRCLKILEEVLRSKHECLLKVFRNNELNNAYICSVKSK